jgi:hypothetical protein
MEQFLGNLNSALAQKFGAVSRASFPAMLPLLSMKAEISYHASLFLISFH